MKTKLKTILNVLAFIHNNFSTFTEHTDNRDIGLLLEESKGQPVSNSNSFLKDSYQTKRMH